MSYEEQALTAMKTLEEIPLGIPISAVEAANLLTQGATVWALMAIVEKLNVIAGKLGEIHDELDEIS